MEVSIKQEKTKAMKKYKRPAAMFFYNLVLYTLTSIITCFFFSYSSFWSPSMKYLLLSLIDNISIFFNAKCFFIVGNLIVFILIRESKLSQSSRSSPAASAGIYDQYLARTHHSANFKINAAAADKYVVLAKMKKEADGFVNIVEEEKRATYKINSIVHVEEEKKKEMSVSKSMGHKIQKKDHHQGGMRKCKSEVWGQSTAISKKKLETKDQLEQKELQVNYHVSAEDLNKRVEDFIARVNKRRLLEAKHADPSNI